MPRTIAAIYDSRAEAELARTRLLCEVKAKSLRILARDTAGAVDGLKIAKRDADAYREALRRGGHLLVAEVPSGSSPRRIVELLEQSAGDVDDEPEDRAWGDPEPGIQVKLPSEREEEEEPPPAYLPEQPGPQVREQYASAPSTTDRSAVDAPVPAADEELRIGRRQVAGGGARVRAFTRDAPAEEQVSLRDEIIDVETRACDRHLTEEQVEAGGLFRDRVFEVAEMREEPVVTKVAVVREEIIVRKTVNERTETVRDTVRQTQVEVEDLPEPEESGPRFFRGGR